MTLSNTDLIALVSDDALLARALSQAVDSRAVVVRLAVLEELAVPERRSLRALVVDGAAFEKGALAELQRLRARHPLARLMFIATPAQIHLLNELQPLRIEVFVRPLPLSVLKDVLGRALSAGRLSDSSLQAWIAELAGECRLNRRDLALMPLVLEMESPVVTRARLGIDQEKLDRALRRLVKKCRIRNTDRLAKNVMRDALLFSQERTLELIEPLSARVASF